MLVVHHVVAGFEILEGGGAFALWLAACLAVGAASAGQVAFGNDADLRVGQGGAPMNRCDHDVAARAQIEHVAALSHCGGELADREIEPLVKEERVQAVS